jgi:Bacterial Ig-like domain (group 3)
MAQWHVRISVRSMAVGASLALVAVAAPPVAAQRPIKGPDVGYPLEFAVSPPVREMPTQARGPRELEKKPEHRLPPRRSSGNLPDPVLQTSTPTPAAAQSGTQWEGLGQAYPGFTVTALPPDPNIAVGPNHIVQWVNNAFVVFDKQGTQLQAPVSDSTFWGIASTCYQGGGFSDPIVQYDRAADRWLIGEVALPLFPGLFGQYAQCFALSVTSDPTGAYYLWAYGFKNDINDYPKIGVWPDGYYLTWNIFTGGSTFAGPRACAFDRQAMLTGASAPARVCFTLSTNEASLLPSDRDGPTPPPAGSPNYLMDLDVNGALHLWRFHVDFANPANSTFTGPTTLADAGAFTFACPTTPDCIPQPGTTQKLDALGDRLMYRLAYRNLGDHESLVANHTVATDGVNTGVRWYEVRSPGSTPVVYQQGTFAPDTENRWMGSIAQDKEGNIAVGYSAGSSTVYPSIRYAGWEVGNTLGMLQAEVSLIEGGGSQTAYDRWGDYSSMRIDPSDDCTFWYTAEYQATTQSANWNTRIGSFRFASCSGSTSGTPTSAALTSSKNPSSLGESVTFTATVSSGSGTPMGTVTFMDGSTPLGSSPLNAGEATLTTATLTGGSHAITAVYNGDSTFATSTSAVLTQVVNKLGSLTSLTSSPNPSRQKQTVTFRATVSPSGATGTVTFLDGSASLGTVNLSGGTAQLATSKLSVGTHSITARYNGDGTYNSSTSAVLTQTVTRR